MEKKNGLAIAALVLAIISVAAFWVPVVNFAVIFIALVGLILGLCALGHPKKTMAIVASALCAVAIVGAILVNHFTTKAVGGAIDFALDQALEEVNEETESVQLQSEIEEAVSEVIESISEDTYDLDPEIDLLEPKDEGVIYVTNDMEPITIYESEDYVYKILGYRISEDKFTGEKVISIKYSFQNFTHEGMSMGSGVLFDEAYQGQYGLDWTFMFDGPDTKDVRDGGITEFEKSYILENEEDDVEYIVETCYTSGLVKKSLVFSIK